MAGNDKLFFEALKELDVVWESPGRNRNHLNDDDDWHSIPETLDHEIQINSQLDLNRNFFTSCFSQEARLVSNPSTDFSIQGSGDGDRISTTDPILGAQQSISEDSEEGSKSSFPVPFVASTGELSWTNDNQSNPSELLSFDDYFNFRNCSPVPQMEPENARSEANTSRQRKKEKGSNCFSETEIMNSDSMPPPQMPLQRDGIAQDSQELKGSSATFSPAVNFSNIETTINTVSVGSVAAAAAVLVAMPSGIQTQSHEMGKAKTFECPVCGKIFSSKYNLQKHGRIHTGEKPFACDTCGKKFAHHDHLKKHRLIHSSERPHGCPWSGCDKKFKHKFQIEVHLRTHTKEKPFTCGKCHKRFAQSGHLKNHLLSHTTDKPYNCKWCGKSFKTKHGCIGHQQRCPALK